MWKLIRVAFTIKGGEAAREGVVKVVPLMMRPVIKRFYSGPVLAAAKGLPFVGKFLLQRNVIKIGIPLVGIPLAVVLNGYTTLLAGRRARAVFRNEARVIELAEGLSERSQHPQLTLWVAWLVIMADGKITDDEALFMRHLVRLVEDRHQVADEKLARLVDVDPAEVWRRLDAEPGDVSDLVDVATESNRGWWRQRPRTRNDLRASRSVRARPTSCPRSPHSCAAPRRGRVPNGHLDAPGDTSGRPSRRPLCVRARSRIRTDDPRLTQAGALTN